MMTTPTANSVVNTTPMLVSSGTSARVWNSCVRNPVRTPTTIAPMKIGINCALPVSRNTVPMAARMEWLMASPSKLMRRKTR